MSGTEKSGAYSALTRNSIVNPPEPGQASAKYKLIKFRLTQVFVWRIIPPGNIDRYEVSNSTKLMLSNDEKLPLFTDEPRKIYLNGTAFVVIEYGVSGGVHHTISLYGDQRAFFEDPLTPPSNINSATANLTSPSTTF